MGGRLGFVVSISTVLSIVACDTAEERDCSVYDEVFVYRDADNDGFGSQEPLGYVCNPGEGQAPNNVDCDDENAAVNPGIDEICDLDDNNCNGLVDEGHPKVPWYPDLDGDNFGGTADGISSCRTPGPEYTQVPGDCDDGDPERNPTANEICNDGIDDDCDGRADDADSSTLPTSRTPYYRDRDLDTYGDPDAVARRCVAPGGFVENNLDCNDRDDAINPEGMEICDRIDNDCDGLLDDCDIDDIDRTGMREFFCDEDGDGFGDPFKLCLACRSTPGFGVSLGTDCDDADPLATLPQHWYLDEDGDGVGAGDPVTASPVCLNPNKPGSTLLVPESAGVDCAAQDSSSYPGAPEVCGDGTDNDCSGYDCASCQDWLTWDSKSTSGVYAIDVGGGTYVDLYCDMDTDGGGWTLVSSTAVFTVNDQREGYYDDLQTLQPESSHQGIYDGLRAFMTADHDVRFACKVDNKLTNMDVDLSFYEVPWYLTWTVGSDGQSCFQASTGRIGALDPEPSRRDNIAGVRLLKGDAYNGTNNVLEGEDFCGDINDFTVDFDDRGMSSNRTDGTDWGEDNATRKCGTVLNPANGAWFIYVREINPDSGLECSI